MPKKSKVALMIEAKIADACLRLEAVSGELTLLRALQDNVAALKRTKKPKPASAPASN